MPLEVAKGINYAMIITTCNGLWRYQIGDTVSSRRSLRTNPDHRAHASLHHAFGEEVIVDNAETALKVACDATARASATIRPVYLHERATGVAPVGRRVLRAA
ncbi:MAG: GH3 auxin-responsive promoter family protein [Alistipes sp.]